MNIDEFVPIGVGKVRILTVRRVKSGERRRYKGKATRWRVYGYENGRFRTFDVSRFEAISWKRKVKKWRRFSCGDCRTRFATLEDDPKCPICESSFVSLAVGAA